MFNQMKQWLSIENSRLKRIQVQRQFYTFREILTPTETAVSQLPALIIGLHGHGSREAQLDTLVALKLEYPTYYIAPRGFYKTANKGFTWFPLTSQSGEMAYDINIVMDSLSRLRLFISAMCAAYQVNANQVYLLGYSQGATMSLAYTLLYPQTIRASVAMAGDLLPEIRQFALEHIRHNQPIFIGHGTMDDFISTDQIQQTADYLNMHGFKVNLHFYPIPHVVSVAERRDVSFWLNQLMAMEI
ncbi:MAG: dienelactone hydrolase family protein [Chloroflexota bacterium]